LIDEYRTAPGLAHFLVVFVTRRLYLQMAAERLQGIVDHQLVGAELQRHHEYEQGVGEHHRAGCQPGTPRLSPDISPGQAQYDIHQSITGIAKIRQGKETIF